MTEDASGGYAVPYDDPASGSRELPCARSASDAVGGTQALAREQGVTVHLFFRGASGTDRLGYATPDGTFHILDTAWQPPSLTAEDLTILKRKQKEVAALYPDVRVVRGGDNAERGGSADPEPPAAEWPGASTMGPAAQAMTRQQCAEIEALERQRGRPFPLDSPILLALLASPPGTPLWSPLPPLEETLMTGDQPPFRPVQPPGPPPEPDPDGLINHVVVWPPGGPKPVPANPGSTVMSVAVPAGRLPFGPGSGRTFGEPWR